MCVRARLLRIDARRRRRVDGEIVRLFALGAEQRLLLLEGSVHAARSPSTACFAPRTGHLPSASVWACHADAFMHARRYRAYELVVKVARGNRW